MTGVGVLLAGLLACGTSDLIAVPGTTTRVSKPVSEKNTELNLKIFTTLEECAGAVKPEDTRLCLPHVDRRSGQVRLAIQFRLDSDPFPIPLTEENLRVVHMGQIVQDAPSMSVEIVPHDPIDAPRLYILVIDSSSSMNETGQRGLTRMDRVKEALLTPGVKSAFFPEGGVRTGVIILSFTAGEPKPVGGRLEVLTDARAYTRAVRDELQVQQGFTHLYDAVRYASGPFLQQGVVRDFIDVHQASPVVIALTDGFNNLASTDTCGTNAERLSRVLESITTSRREAEDLRKRPTIFTVGLGRPIRPLFKLPKGRESAVQPTDLCGKKYVDRRIDGDLEREGIDNVSLTYIANRGGGFEFIKTDRDGLAEAFRAAAAQRYTWFEIRYQVDPHYLRRSFETRLRLTSFADAESSLRIYPSAWLDGPPGRREADNRIVAQSYRHTATVIMPVLGALVGLGFLGAISFNGYRIVFRRGRRGAAGGAKPPGGAGKPAP